MAEEMTIDELASRAGLPSSTVRLYQTKGLVPPPRRAGRHGYYGSGHLARLRLITDLQERGFSLAAIKQLVDAWEIGRGLDDLLGLESQVVAARSEPVRLTVEELAGHLAGQVPTPETLRRVLRLGLAELLDDGTVATDPRFLAFGTQLSALGIPADEILDEWEALQASTERVAKRFVAVFKRHLWRPFVEAGMPPERVAGLTEALRGLGPLAEEVVVTALRLALERAAAAFVAEQAHALEDAGLLDQVRAGLQQR
jgi:DNA-binding transcriptional MerR regulator